MKTIVLSRHEKKINKFIEKAEGLADKKLKESKDHYVLRKGKNEPYNHCLWSQYFHEAMDKLTVKAGLRIKGGVQQ